MAMYTANGLPLLSAVLRMPRNGGWHLDAVVPPQTAASMTGLVGAVDVQLGGLALTGVIDRSGFIRDMNHVRILGGAGMLGSVLPGRAYKQPLGAGLVMGQVISDLVSDAGEELSSTVVPSTVSVDFWVRLTMPAADALTIAADKISAAWRVLTDGTIWVGTETWPDVTAQFTGQLADEWPAENRSVFFVADPQLTPGVTLFGGQVSAVIHECPPGGELRTHVLWEDTATGVAPDEDHET